MPKKKRSTVGERRKHHFKSKSCKGGPIETQRKTENETTNLPQTSYYDGQTTKETKQLQTMEVQTQTKENEGDHLYAKGFEEMEKDSFVYEAVQYEMTSNDTDSVTSETEREVEVEEVTVTVESEQFKTLTSDIKKCASERDFSVRETENDITLIKFYLSDSLSVKYTIQLDSCFNCKVFVHRKAIEPSHILWRDLPRVFSNLDSFLKLLDKLETLNVCCGNSNVEFQTLVPIGAALTSKTDTTVLAYR